MAWEVVYTDEFESWWNGLTEDEQISVNRKVLLLQWRGPALARPHADVIHSSRFPNMKELRVQHEGRPYRVLFIFDPQRNAVLLIGGDKTGTTTGTKNMYPKRMRSTRNIWRRKRTHPESIPGKWGICEN